MILKRIKSESYDKLLDLVVEKDFFDSKLIDEFIEKNSEEVKINDEIINININIEKYKKILNENDVFSEIDWLVSQQLHKDFCFLKNNSIVSAPKNIMYEKEVWAYLNLTVFYEFIKERYFSKNSDDNDSNKFKRLFLCYGSQIDRTGLRWLWVLADITYYQNNYDLTKIAIDFIDPFKAINEGVLRKSEIVSKAFALAIKKLKLNPKIKNKKNRTIIPKHIRNYACSIMLDGTNSVEILSDLFVNQIKMFI